MCTIYNSFLGGKLSNDLEVNVEFMDSVSNNLTEVSNSVKTLSDAKAISTDTKVRMVHPEWTDTQVQEEVERILNDESAGMPMDNPEDLTEMDFGKNHNENNLGSSDVKSEGHEGIEE